MSNFKPKIIKEGTWHCIVHKIDCKFGSPCYECKREIQNESIIEAELAHHSEVRERNAKPRYH